MTRQIITGTATGERLQLRRAEINSSHNSYSQVWSQFMYDGEIPKSKAGLYQRLENPRIFSSSGMTSKIDFFLKACKT
jgi:hypothetical protein